VKKLVRSGIAVSVAGVLALVASPAYAASYSGAEINFGDAKNTNWGWSSFTNGSLGDFSDDEWQSGTDNSTWNGTDVQLGSTIDDAYSIVTCSDPADLSTASDGSGDRIVLCDAVDITTASGVLTAQLEFRFFADLHTVRTRVIVTNNTASTIADAMAYMNYDAFQDSGTYVYAATNSAPDFTDPLSTPDYITTAADLRWVTDDRESEEDAPVVGYAIGRAGAAVAPSDDAAISAESGGQGDGNDSSNTYFEIPELASGESVEFVTMAQVYLVIEGSTSGTLDEWETATKAADELAWANTDIDSDAFVFAGITDPTKVANWSPASTPELPDTGVSALGFGALALTLMGAGVAFLVIRRRAQA